MAEMLTAMGVALFVAALGLAGWEVRERMKARRERMAAYRRLDWMVDEVADAGGKEDHHEYVARYKEDWRQELADLADTDREWLDDLYAVVKEISRRIKYHSFDHADPDSDGYCVDELVVDLLALQLELTLHRMPFKRKEAQARAVALAEQMLRVQMGPRVGMSVAADGTVTVPSWMDEFEAEANAYAEGWRDRTAELPPLPGVGELAIARVWRWSAQ